MTNSEVEILDNIIKPGGYSAQLKFANLYVKHILDPGLKKFYYFETFDPRTVKVEVLHIKTVSANDVMLLPIRQTLREYIDKNIPF